ncbi:hypothetical protein [Haloferula sargassicola]|uniref:Asl1-like glycosyl hydrolase catalytic domain-containing protein n=1 Tax=Haloferula sargassicola TaxID=490096 RepID=A0ABP9UIH6_9BACT
MKFLARFGILLALLVNAPAAERERPLFRDYMGINGHFTFKPELYLPTARLVRNYHNLNWDAQAPGDELTFPTAKNGVRWVSQVYRPWHEAGYEIDVCIQFAGFGGDDGNQALAEASPAWLESYGSAVAGTLGSCGEKLVSSMEIGNEPGTDIDPDVYAKVFTHMAKGIRRSDPEMKILTATAHARDADKYSLDLRKSFASPELRQLYDVINVHTYAMLPKKEGRSPWARSFPEDPEIDYLKVVDEAIDWRDHHAPGKEVWVTEFGYDAPTPEALERRTGWFEKLDWRGVSEEEQARYLVRSYLVFAMRDVARAYLYFYNDDDGASVHGASGLTRKFVPKPAYFAVRHLHRTLGDYRLTRVVRQETDGLHLLEFSAGDNPRRKIWVAWLATGGDETRNVQLEGLPGRISKIEIMPCAEGEPPTPSLSREDRESGRIAVSGTPAYLHFDL